MSIDINSICLRSFIKDGKKLGVYNIFQVFKCKIFKF